jgi:hypothetical protein
MMIRLPRVLIVLLMTCCLVSSCASRSSEDVFRRSYDYVIESAERRIDDGDYGRAFVLADALLNVNAFDTRALVIKDEAVAGNPDLARLEDRELLGRNFPLRLSRRSGIPVKILLWPVNLFTDLLDCLTVEAGLGLGVGAKAQVTEPASIGGQFSLGASYVGLQNRHPAVRATFDEYLDFFPFELKATSEASYGTFGAYAAKHSGTGVKKPSDRLYHRARDYWAVGAEASAAIVNVNVKLHPLQLGDWIAGIFFFDPLTDNVGTTKSVGRLDPDEMDAIRRLVRN